MCNCNRVQAIIENEKNVHEQAQKEEKGENLLTLFCSRTLFPRSSSSSSSPSSSPSLTSVGICLSRHGLMTVFSLTHRPSLHQKCGRCASAAMSHFMPVPLTDVRNFFLSLSCQPSSHHRPSLGTSQTGDTPHDTETEMGDARSRGGGEGEQK